MRARKPWYRRNRGWYVEIGGRQIPLAKGPKTRDTKDSAERRFHELMVECAANPTVDGGAPTVASVIEAFLDHAVQRDAESTFYERKLYLQRFADELGGRLVDVCKAYHLTKWVDGQKTWKSDWTRSYVIRAVKRPFNWAVKQGLIASNPFASVEHRPGERRRPMTDAEYEKLLKKVGRRSRLGEVLQFIAGTGCRPAEARHLRWEHIDWTNSMAIQQKHKTSKTQRKHQPRVIILTPAIVTLLTQIRGRHDDQDYVFLNQRHRPWGRCSIQQALRRARRELGLPEDVKLYGLRHRFGTKSIKNSVDLKTTAELLGHTTTRMTEHYVHLAGEYEHLRAAAQRAAK